MESRPYAPLGSRNGLIPTTRSCWTNTIDRSLYLCLQPPAVDRVDVLSAFVSPFAGLFIVFRRDTIDAGAAGLSLTYSLPFTHHVLWFVRTLAYNDININCVERVQEYMALPQEAPTIVQSYRPPAGWPRQGEIRVQNLVMQYAPDEPVVIRDISLYVSPHEKIGIVGRIWVQGNQPWRWRSSGSWR